MIGISVFIIDFGKGLLSVFIVNNLYSADFTLMALALFSAVLAHCFSPWLNFKGGRGIATAAGGASALFPVLLFLWIAFWVLMYLFKKDIHLSNIVATVMVILVSIFYSDLLNKYSTPPAESNLLFGTYVSIIMLIVLYKHINPFKEYLIAQKNIGVRKK